MSVIDDILGTSSRREDEDYQPDLLLTAALKAREELYRFDHVKNAANLARRELSSPPDDSAGRDVDEEDAADRKRDELLRSFEQFMPGLLEESFVPKPDNTFVATGEAAVPRTYFADNVLPDIANLVLGTTVNSANIAVGLARKAMRPFSPEPNVPLIQAAPTTEGLPQFSAQNVPLGEAARATGEGLMAPFKATTEALVSDPIQGYQKAGFDGILKSIEENIEKGGEFIENQPITAAVMGLTGLALGAGALPKGKMKPFLPSNGKVFFESDVPNVLSGDANYAHVYLDSRGKGFSTMRSQLGQLYDQAKASGKSLRSVRSKDPDRPGLNIAIYDDAALKESLTNLGDPKGTKGFVSMMLLNPERTKTAYGKTVVEPLRRGNVTIVEESPKTTWLDVVKSPSNYYAKLHWAAGQAQKSLLHSVLKNRSLAETYIAAKNNYYDPVKSKYGKDFFGKTVADLDKKAGQLGDEFDFDTEVQAFPQDVQIALRGHKQLMEHVREAIKSEMVAQGVPEELATSWGKDGYYFPRLFEGNWEIKGIAPGSGAKDFVTRAKTRGEGMKIMRDLKKKGYAGITVNFDNVIPGEMVSRLPKSQLERLIATIGTKSGATRDEILDWLKREDETPVVGAKERKKKQFRSTQERTTSPVTGEEYEFWNTNYDKVMDVYLQGASRYLALNEGARGFWKAHQQIPTSMRDVRNGLEGLLQDVMGRQSPFSGKVDEGLKRAVRPLQNGLDRMGIALNVEPRPMAWERYMGGIRTVQANLKLGTFAASTVNALQTFQTLWPRVSTSDFIAGWKESFSKEAIQEARDAGILGLPMKLEGVHLGKTGKETQAGLLYGMSKTEQMNRVAAYTIGKRQAKTAKGRYMARQLGMDPNDPNFVKNYAIDMVAATQFDMSAADIPLVFRGELLRTMLQFKPFMTKYVEATANLRKQPDAMRSYAKWATAQMATGGLKTLTSPVALAKSYGILKLYQEIRDESGEETADAFVYGFPGFIKMDMASRLGVDLFPTFGRTDEEKIVNYLAGPTVGDLIDLKKTLFTDPKDGDAWMAYLKGLFPLVKNGRSLWSLIQDDKYLRDGRGKPLTPADPTDHLLEALGFSSMKRTQAYDVRYNLKDEPELRGTFERFLQE